MAAERACDRRTVGWHTGSSLTRTMASEVPSSGGGEEEASTEERTVVAQSGSITRDAAALAILVRARLDASEAGTWPTWWRRSIAGAVQPF